MTIVALKHHVVGLFVMQNRLLVQKAPDILSQQQSPSPTKRNSSVGIYYSQECFNFYCVDINHYTMYRTVFHSQKCIDVPMM